jgi:hypothetical protein
MTTEQRSAILAGAFVALMGGVYYGTRTIIHDTPGVACSDHVRVDWVGAQPANCLCQFVTVIGPGAVWSVTQLCEPGADGGAVYARARIEGAVPVCPETGAPGGIALDEPCAPVDGVSRPCALGLECKLRPVVTADGVVGADLRCAPRGCPVPAVSLPSGVEVIDREECQCAPGDPQLEVWVAPGRDSHGAAGAPLPCACARKGGDCEWLRPRMDGPAEWIPAPLDFTMNAGQFRSASGTGCAGKTCSDSAIVGFGPGSSMPAECLP